MPNVNDPDWNLSCAAIQTGTSQFIKNIKFSSERTCNKRSNTMTGKIDLSSDLVSIRGKLTARKKLHAS